MHSDSFKKGDYKARLAARLAEHCRPKSRLLPAFIVSLTVCRL